MNKSSEQKLFDISIIIIKVLICVMLLFNAIVFVYYGMINRRDVYEKEPVIYLNDWKVSDSETGDQIIRGTIPGDVKDNEYLFCDIRSDVSVYINDSLRKDFIETRDVIIPGGIFRRFLLPVPLSEADSGAQVTIVRYSPDDDDRDIPEFFISTFSGTKDHLLKTLGLPFILSFIVLIFSFAAFVVSIVLRLWYRQKIDMMYGALCIFVIASWLITDSRLFPFVVGVNHVNGLLSYVFCLTMPLPLLVYLSSVQCGRYKKTTAVVALIAILNAVGWPFLHFTDIVSYDNAITAANIVLVILALSGFGILIVDAVKGNIREYRYTFIGFLGFLTSCLIELTAVILEFSFIKESTSMVIGLGFLLTFIVIQQVHDLRKINMEKQHAIDISEAKTRFLASMSHEIRTPINAILGMNEMILRENSDNVIDEYARSIRTSGKMLLMLVNDVLDFTKIEAGKLEITETEFSVSDMLYDVISLIKERAEEKNLSLGVELTEEIPATVISDEFRIRQILVNLMNNAVKYTEKGSITLKLGGSYTEERFLLSFSVCDTGKGIRTEDQEHLFEAFSRADLKSNANIEGTGLGLAIVKSIVDSMNGELGVESEYGKGSRFWVKLPVEYTNKEPLKDDFLKKRTEQTEDIAACSFTAPDAKILAVDDNQSNLTIVRLFLKRNGIVPDLCSSGLRAIEMCKEKKYDLILMDHMMPEPDGIETLQIIRNSEDSLNKDTKAVVLTANAVAGSREVYMSKGFDDYLTKPLDSNVLEEMVKNMLPKDKVSEAASVDLSQDDEPGAGKKDLSSIEGLDYDAALLHCAGDKELLFEVIGDIVTECPPRIERMKKSLETKDINAYQIDAHAIKSSMATIGMNKFSERAKKHEFAAKDNDIDYILGDAGEFMDEYLQLCNDLEKHVGDVDKTAQESDFGAIEFIE